MLSKERVKDIYIKELELKKFFPKEDWEKVYKMLVEDEDNANILDTEEHLVNCIGEFNKERGA